MIRVGHQRGGRRRIGAVLVVLATAVALSPVGWPDPGGSAVALPPAPSGTGVPLPATVAWLGQAGGEAVDSASAVDAAPDGTIVWSGSFAGTATFGTGDLARSVATAPRSAPFVASTTAQGSLRWVTALRPTRTAAINEVAAQPDGGAVAVGTFSGSLQVGATTLTASAHQSLFVVSFDTTGAPRWAVSPRSTRPALGLGATVAADGTAVVVGTVSGAMQLGTPPSPLDVDATAVSPLVVAYRPDGTAAWARTLPSPLGVAVAVDAADDGSAVAVGAFAGTLGGIGPSPLTSDGGLDAFAVRFAADGTPTWATPVGGAGAAVLFDVAVTADGSTALIGGATLGPGQLGATALPAAGDADGLVALLDGATGTPGWRGGVGGPGTDAVIGAHLDGAGQVLAAGPIEAGAVAWGSGPDRAVPAGTTVVAWGSDGAPAGATALPGEALAGAAGAGEQMVVATSFDGTVTAGDRSVTSRGRADALLVGVGPKVNQAPVVAGGAVKATPGADRPIVVRGGDPDGDPVTWTVTPPTHGTLAGAPPTLTYRSDPDHTGPDVVEVTATDPGGLSSTATVTIDVGANAAPTLVVDPVTTLAGDPVAVPVHAADVDGDDVSVTVTSPPTLGTLSGPVGDWTFTPHLGAVGNEVIELRATDGIGGSATAAVPVSVLAPGANRPPRRTPSPAATTGPERATTMAVGAVDPDGDPVAIAVVGTSVGGTATVTGPDEVRYQPAPGFLGSDAVVVELADPQGATTTVELPVHVKRPNVVVVLTDDQTLEQLRWMPRTRALVGGAGTTFSDAVVSYAECCPARATLLTGQHAHNHGVVSSALPTGGVTKLDDDQTLAVWLQGAGYHTVLAGKYLNGYGLDLPTSYVPPGWSDWFALADPYTYDYLGGRLSDGGTQVDLPATEQNYTTDVLADRIVDTIGDHQGSPTPVFALYAPVAPHVADEGRAPLPATRHQGSKAGVTAPRSPAFDEADVSDKPWAIRSQARLSPDEIEGIDQHYRSGAETLAAVDEAVEAIWQALDATGELDNTLIIITSDNGAHFGEHRIRSGKSRPYEESIRVPLLIAGPGFPAGATAAQPVANVDLAPTISGVTGVALGRPTDGVDLRPVANDPELARSRKVLIENGPLAGRPLYWGVRDDRWVFVQRSTGERELYDRRTDPAQLTNLASSPAHSLRVLYYGGLARSLKTCAADTCRVGT